MSWGLPRFYPGNGAPCPSHWQEGKWPGTHTHTHTSACSHVTSVCTCNGALCLGLVQPCTGAHSLVTVRAQGKDFGPTYLPGQAPCTVVNLCNWTWPPGPGTCDSKVLVSESPPI